MDKVNKKRKLEEDEIENKNSNKIQVVGEINYQKPCRVVRSQTRVASQTGVAIDHVYNQQPRSGLIRVG
jgi:hypothetical protein